MKKYDYSYNILINYSQVGEKVIFYDGKKELLSFEEFFTRTSNKSLKSYCINYKKKHIIRSMIKHQFKNLCNLFNIMCVFRSHLDDSYFKALVEYKETLTNNNSNTLQLNNYLNA